MKGEKGFGFKAGQARHSEEHGMIFQHILEDQNSPCPCFPRSDTYRLLPLGNLG